MNMTSMQPVSADSTPEQQTLFNLSELAITNKGEIEQLTKDIKNANEMLQAALENDTQWREADDESAEARDIKKQAKSRLMQSQTNRELVQKIKDLRREKKEKQQAVSDYALEYHRLSKGETNIEREDGSTYIIVRIAKLVKVKS